MNADSALAKFSIFLKMLMVVTLAREGQNTEVTYS